MSERSIKRANERRADRERRRAALRRRRAGLTAGAAAVGASVIFASGAEAATFQVNTLTDGPADACDTTCTLRDAITEADAAAGADTVTFAPGLTGTIVL